MESKHSPPAPTSPPAYIEPHRGITLTLEFDGELVRGIAAGDPDGRGLFIWQTPWGRSWISVLERLRADVDRYLNALELVASWRRQGLERRELAAGAGTLELVGRHPRVSS